MLFPSRTVLTAMRLADLARMERIAQLRVEFDALRTEIKARREAKYSPDQPRDERGRWTFGQGTGTDDAGADNGLGLSDLDDGPTTEGGIGTAPDGGPIEPVGGIPSDKLNWTTQQFMSAYCKGSIREVMPGQFLQMPIADVLTLAGEGNAAANRCIKLLKEDRFRK